MLETAELLDYIYEKGTTHEAEIEKHVNLYKILVKAGYAYEVEENNFLYNLNRTITSCSECIHFNNEVYKENCNKCRFQNKPFDITTDSAIFMNNYFKSL